MTKGVYRELYHESGESNQMRAISQGLYQHKNTFYLRVRAAGKEAIRSLGCDLQTVFYIHNVTRPAINILAQMSRDRKIGKDIIESYRDKTVELIDAVKASTVNVRNKMDDELLNKRNELLKKIENDLLKERKKLLDNIDELSEHAYKTVKDETGLTSSEYQQLCKNIYSTITNPESKGLIKEDFIDEYVNRNLNLEHVKDKLIDCPHMKDMVIKHLKEKAEKYYRFNSEKNKVFISYSAGLEKEYDATIGKMESQLARIIIENDQKVIKYSSDASIENTLSLSDAFNKFIDEKNTTKNPLKEKNLNEFKQSVDEVIEFLGDKPLDKYTLLEFRQFEATMLKIPARYRVSRGLSKQGEKLKFYNLTIKEISELNIKDGGFTAYSISQKLQNIQSIYKWFNITSPLSNFEFITKASNPRGGYSKAEIDKIKEYSLNLPESDKFAKWLFLIAIYTGARLSEITQLTKSDIMNDPESGILYFDFNDDDEKELKNEQSKRQVPIHNELIKLGLLDFIDNNEVLFPEKPPGYTTYSNYANRKILKKIFKHYSIPKVTSEGNRVFHSFRHTFIDYLLNEKGCRIDYVKDLVGHEKDMGITGTYSKRKHKITLLKIEIDKLEL